jgi:hypothetical protein
MHSSVKEQATFSKKISKSNIENKIFLNGALLRNMTRYGEFWRALQIHHKIVLKILKSSCNKCTGLGECVDLRTLHSSSKTFLPAKMN